MSKHIATVAGVGVAVVFVAIFFVGRTGSKELKDIAPRIGMSTDEMLAIGPRIATQTGATLGTSRRVVYLLACSGQVTKSTLESQAIEASRLAREQRLTDREAVTAVLSQRHTGSAADSLSDC